MKKSILFVLILLGIFGSITMHAQELEPKGKINSPKGFKEKSHNFFMSGRLELATHQRDSLNTLAVKYAKDTTERGIRYRFLDSLFRDLTGKHNQLTADYAKLNSDYQEMHNRYTDLIKSSLSKTEQLNLALREKTEQLEARDALLKGRDEQLKLRDEQLKARERKLAELESIIRKQDSLTNALNDLVKKALLSFNSEDLTVEMKNGKVYVSLSDKLLFKSGSATVEEKGLDALKKLAEVLNKNPEIDILIEGHTDNIPIKTAQFSDNWDLSTARANNIVRYLSKDHRVDPKRLTAAGRSEFQPRASNDASEGRARNRRTEIILSPKLDELFKVIEKRR